MYDLLEMLYERYNAFGCYEYPVQNSYTLIRILREAKYSLQGTTQGRYLTGGVPPVRFSM